MNLNSSMLQNDPILKIAKQALDIEITALQRMRERLDQEFEKAIQLILDTQGRVVVIGMGKSGIIGQKIAATFASTGTTSFFVHPGEAFHGDLGMIHPADAVLLLSNSGETEEILRILPFLEYQKNSVIAITGNVESTLSKYAHAVLDVSVEREACANNLAPTSSTTNTLAMGDALAVTLIVKRQFQPEDFARFHPGGSLGRRLLTRVKDVMHEGALPICKPSATFQEIVNTITYGRLGLVLVMCDDGLKGVITDGDLRRSFENIENIKYIYAKEIMTPNPLTVNANIKLNEAEKIMRDRKINALIVIENENVIGVVQLLDLI